MDNINLEKVIEIYNKLLHGPDKETGTSFFYKCPYHKEKTPSFAVKKENGIFKCFGCGKSGNIITLIKDHFSGQQDELFQFLGLGYGNGKSNKTFNIKDNTKKEIIKNLPGKIENRLNKRDIDYLHNRGFTNEFIKKYNFFTINNNIITNTINNIEKGLKNKGEDKDDDFKEKGIEKILGKYKNFLEKQSEYYNGYLIIPVMYQNSFTNNHMFIGRNISSYNGPRYKNEKLNKGGKTFFIGKSNDNIITITEGAIDGMIYNNFTNKSVNLLLGANKISYENKIITFLTDNDQAGFDFLGNLYDLNNMLSNNNVNYIFWAISYKETFKSFFLKYISDKYNFDIEANKFNELIDGYGDIIIEIKDINDLYKFLIKMLYITEITLGKNKIDKFIKKISFNNVIDFDFINIPYDFIERKDVQNDILNFINIFDKANIEQNTFLIFFFYYNIIKNKIDVIDNIDIQFFIDKLKEDNNISDTSIKNIKKIVVLRNPYFIMSILLYYFGIEQFIKISNLFLYKTNNNLTIEKNIIKEFGKFVKKYKITLLQPELLYLLKKVNLIGDEQYKKVINNIESQSNNNYNNNSDVDYQTILKSKMYYGRIFIVPLIYSLFKNTEVGKDFLLNLITRNNKDILNIIELIDRINKENTDKFLDIYKINELRKIFYDFIMNNYNDNFKVKDIGIDFLNIFGLDRIDNLSEFSYIIELMNKKDIEKNIELIWLENLLKIKNIKDVENFIDKYNIDKDEFKENISKTLNDLNSDNDKWSELTFKTDDSIIVNMTQNNRKRIEQKLIQINKTLKLNKIILGVLQSFIMYV